MTFTCTTSILIWKVVLSADVERATLLKREKELLEEQQVSGIFKYRVRCDSSCNQCKNGLESILVGRGCSEHYHNPFCLFNNKAIK